MTIKIIGEQLDVERRTTGSWSLDRALSSDVTEEAVLGMPMRAAYEMFGPGQSGKTTLAQRLAAMGSDKPGRIAFMEIENRIDKEYVHSNLEFAGFDGEVLLIPRKRSGEKKKAEGKQKWKNMSHTDCLNELAGELLNSKTTAGLLDSVSALVSEGQAERKIGEQKPGDEAKLMWQLLRKAVYAVGRGRMPGAPPVNLFIISHTQGVIGGRGYTTSGGTAGEKLCTVRMNMWPKDYEADGSFQVTGTVAKLTYGPSKRKFQLFLLSGRGIHTGLSAMADCVAEKIAKRESRGIIMGGKNMGRIGTLLAAARSGNEKKFAPFYKALKEYKCG